MADILNIFYSTRKQNPLFESHLHDNATGEVLVHEFINDGSVSLTAAYNIAMKEAEGKYLLLVHDDVRFKRGYDAQILSYLQGSPYGVLGVAGSPVMDTSGIWWNQRHHMSGKVWHTDGKKKWLSSYSAWFQGEPMETVVVDGLLMALNLDNIKVGFDESFVGFHYYDVDFCTSNFLAGVKIGVMSQVEVLHKSVGAVSPQWHLNRKRYLDKYQGKLPLVAPPSVIYDDSPVDIPHKPRLATVVVSKTPELADKCFASFSKSTYPMELHLCNTHEDPKAMDEVAQRHGATLYHQPYHFATNNNSIVETLDEGVELVLFCNDDIELLNDAVSHMVAQWDASTGTVGARLHRLNGTVQHGGIAAYFDKSIKITHRGIGTFYGVGNENRDVMGNTGAFMLVSRADFLGCGGFPTQMEECFEDLMLNLCLLRQGKTNKFVGSAVCLHDESHTRGKSPEKQQREARDYNERLIPYIRENISWIKPHISGFPTGKLTGTPKAKK